MRGHEVEPQADWVPFWWSDNEKETDACGASPLEIKKAPGRLVGTRVPFVYLVAGTGFEPVTAGSFRQCVAAVGANGACGIDVPKAVMESTLLGLFLYDSDRGLTFNDGDPLRFDGLFEGEAFEGFFHLDPTLFNLLRFFQLSVFRHSLLTHPYLH